jgi:DNA topoisomerase VI subunit B
MADVHAEFRDAVNMTASELRKWLDSDESQEVGQKRSAGAESVGHDSGRKIVQILGKKKADLTDADEQHMRKVVGYVHRHMAQGPNGDVAGSRWRHSLMNWGHDPLKQDR